MIPIVWRKQNETSTYAAIKRGRDLFSEAYCCFAGNMDWDGDVSVMNLIINKLITICLGGNKWVGLSFVLLSALGVRK